MKAKKRNRKVSSVWWINVVRRYQRRRLDGLLPANEFHALMMRERARADRSDDCFSLVVFDTENPRSGNVPVSSLVPVLQSRLRTSDEAGWFDERRVGIVLPYTRVAGATKVAKDISAAVSQPSQRLAFKVYVYPSHVMPEGRGRAEPSVRVQVPENSQLEEVLAEQVAQGSESDARIPVAHELAAGELAQIESMEDVLGHGIPFWKRSLDVVLCLIALTILSPLFAALTVFIKIVSPGPIFFRQERIGYQGRMFTCWKFRTMKLNADTQIHQQHFTQLMGEDRPMQKLDTKHDARLIPLGKVIRLTGIDELPQIINVLRGEMSFIGPRPCIPV